MKGELYINEKDAYETWGVSFESTALSTLMTPAGMKDHISNASRLEDGERVVLDGTGKCDSREITLAMHIRAATESEFLTRYASFCEELKKRHLAIRTKYQPDTTYHCLYVSCTQFSQYFRELGLFSLKVFEPNPANRTATSTNITEIDDDATDA